MRARAAAPRAGAATRANQVGRVAAGRTFEAHLALVHAIYRRRGLAVVTKCHPAVVGKPGAMRFSEASDVDYVGAVAGGRALAFDAKGATNRASYDPPDPRDPRQYALERRQLEYLRDVQASGGLAFLLVHCATLGGCWVLADVAALLAGRPVPIRSLVGGVPVHHLPYAPESTVRQVAEGAPRWDYLAVACAETRPLRDMG